MGKTKGKSNTKNKIMKKTLYCNDKKFRKMKKSKRGAKFSFKCIRKRDGTVFDMPRLYSSEECEKDISGFTKRSSCAPFL